MFTLVFGIVFNAFALLHSGCPVHAPYMPRVYVRRARCKRLIVTTFKKYCNLFNILVRAAKKIFYDKLFQKFQSNLSKTWQLINEIINKKSKKNAQSFSHLIINNHLKVEDPFTIANKFNEFFTTIAQKIADEIIPTDKPPDYSPTSPDDVIFSLKNNPVTHSEVFEAINMLQKKKTADMFGVSIFFIAKFALTLSKPLRNIFNLSFSHGVVPQQFKIAKVIPIHKSGPKDSMDNYRPIALVCSFSKILEKITFNRLSLFLENNNLLSPNSSVSENPTRQFILLHFLSTKFQTL